jgi:hypothetical protein
MIEQATLPTRAGGRRTSITCGPASAAWWSHRRARAGTPIAVGREAGRGRRLTLHRALAVTVCPCSDGPCARGILCRAPKNRRHGFPRSHGPSAEQLALQRLTFGKWVGHRRPPPRPRRRRPRPRPTRVPGSRHWRWPWSVPATALAPSGTRAAPVPSPGGSARAERQGSRASGGGIGRGHNCATRRSVLATIVPTAPRAARPASP